MRALMNASRKCDLCRQLRLGGSELEGVVGKTPVMWVCSDCQQMLGRRLDDDGALGG